MITVSSMGSRELVVCGLTPIEATARAFSVPSSSTSGIRPGGIGKSVPPSITYIIISVFVTSMVFCPMCVLISCIQTTPKFVWSEIAL